MRTNSKIFLIALQVFFILILTVKLTLPQTETFNVNVYYPSPEGDYFNINVSRNLSVAARARLFHRVSIDDNAGASPQYATGFLCVETRYPAGPNSDRLCIGGDAAGQDAEIRRYAAANRYDVTFYNPQISEYTDIVVENITFRSGGSWYAPSYLKRYLVGPPWDFCQPGYYVVAVLSLADTLQNYSHFSQSGKLLCARHIN